MMPPNAASYFERIEDGCVSGWSYDEDGQPAPIIVQVNGVLAATSGTRRVWPWSRWQNSSRLGRFEVRLRLVPGDRVEVFQKVTGRPLPGGVRRVVNPRWRPRLGLVAPVKEEEPYLLEWIAYHRALGIEYFMLGDNGGADRTSELLQALDAAGLIQRLDWRGEEGFQARFDTDAIPRMRGIASV